MPEPAYGVEFTKSYNDDFAKFRRDKIITKKAKAAVDKLRAAPYKKSRCLDGDYKTLRKHKTGKLRLIFAICEECKAKGYDAVNSRYCPVSCDSLPPNTLMFFHFWLRKEAYK